MRPAKNVWARGRLSKIREDRRQMADDRRQMTFYLLK
jgi:hypothetical protein